MKRRSIAFMLAVALFVLTPVSDYTGARESHAVGSTVALTAVEYVLGTLFSLLGVDAFDNDLPSVAVDLGEYVQVGPGNKYAMVYSAIAQSAFGSVLNLGQDALNMVKDYLKYRSVTESTDSYPIGVPESAFPSGLEVSSADGLPAFGDFSKSWASQFGMDPVYSPDRYITSTISIVSDSGIRYDDYFFGEDTKNVRYCGIYRRTTSRFGIEVKKIDSDGRIYDAVLLSTIYYPSTGKISYGRTNEVVLNDVKGDASLVTDAYLSSVIHALGIPVFESEIGAEEYLRSGVVGDAVYSWESTAKDIGINIISDIFNSSVSIGDTISIPADSALAQELLESVQAGSTAEQRADALAPTLTVIYGGRTDPENPEEPDGTFPWLPDIKGAIDALGKKLSEFPWLESILKAIKEAAESINSQIKEGISKVTAVPWVSGILGSISGLGSQITGSLSGLQSAIDSMSSALSYQLNNLVSPLNAINGFLNGILPAFNSSLGAILEAVKAIPQHLIDTLNEVKAIPGHIQDFFTVDTVAVGASASALRETFMGKFEPLTALVGVFKNASGSMNDEIPVIKMKVPPRLAEVVGGEEIVVFDLRGYEEYVTLFRNLVRCSIWISFAFAVMAMFRVRFHVG
ncbi:hypothetical protein AALB39_02105 [Lachnospiraceae bacterium 54-53]